MVYIQGEAYSFELTHITQLPGKGAFHYMFPDHFKQVGGKQSNRYILNPLVDQAASYLEAVTCYTGLTACAHHLRLLRWR